MQTIRVLKDSLISKIAAGEVIDRPVSVIKELVENSIDAGSKNIEVKVSNDNFDFEIIDDGKGMSKEDLELCLTRHATSKIEDVDDLFNINSLGFRGEALASIASISRMKIVTKQESEEVGYELTWENKNQEIAETGAKNGTQIMIRDLFYNTPVRKKFLKSPEKEFKEILDIMIRFSLYYHELSFKLYKDEKLVFRLNKSSNPLQSLIDVYGVEISKNMVPVNLDEGPIRIQGFLSKPGITRSNKEHQTIFLNGRHITNKVITDAIYEGYHSMLFIKRHPLFVIKIDVDPKEVDVNVHPTKKEIRIKQEKLMFDTIKDAVYKALTKDSLKDRIFQEANEEPNIIQEQLLVKQEAPKIVREEKNVEEKLSTSLQATLEVHEEEENYVPKLDDMPRKERDYKILGQVKKCFIIAENTEGMMLIDQHTAEERINYDKLMKQYSEHGIKKQELLQPILINLSAIDAETLRNNLDQLEQLGFNIEHFGDNSFNVRTVPVIFSRQQSNDEITNIIDELLVSNTSESLMQKKEAMITRMACRASIMRGTEMTTIQMYELVDKLLNSTLPNTCPHGRPIIITFTMNDLEKMFRRK